MKRLILLLFLTVLTVPEIFGQVSDYTDYLNGTKPLTDIANLKTAKDFDQSSLTAEQIDEKISALFRNAKDEQNYSLEIPYNSKQLSYVGKKHPKNHFLVSSDAFTYRLAHINKDLEIYTYDGIYILLPNKDAKSLLNLFFTVRALTIMKARYNEAYLYLIKQNHSSNASSYLLQRPYRRASAINKNNSIISFDNSPADIAANTADLFFGNKVAIGGWEYFENTNNLVTSIDNETILGNDVARGSKPLYNLARASDNYFYYMRDGLIETLIHENVHQYISNSGYIDEKAFFINEMRNDVTDHNFDFDVEEAIVLNTCLKYYKLKGGVSPAVISFYTKMLQTKKELLTRTFNYSDKLNLQRYYALKALSDQSALNFEEVYYLNVLNN